MRRRFIIASIVAFGLTAYVAATGSCFRAYDKFCCDMALYPPDLIGEACGLFRCPDLVYRNLDLSDVTEASPAAPGAFTNVVSLPMDTCEYASRDCVNNECVTVVEKAETCKPNTTGGSPCN